MEKSLALVTAAVFLLFGNIVLAAGLSDQDETMVIKNSKGEYLGTVKDLLIDSSGRVIFVIVSHGEEREGISRKDIAVPAVAFSYDRDQDRVVLDIAKDQLDAAPEFTVSELDDPLFSERVFQFFGLAPFWSDGKPHGVPAGGDRIE